jgi:hypothetical protein
VFEQAHFNLPALLYVSPMGSPEEINGVVLTFVSSRPETGGARLKLRSQLEQQE